MFPQTTTVIFNLRDTINIDSLDKYLSPAYSKSECGVLECWPWIKPALSPQWAYILAALRVLLFTLEPGKLRGQLLTPLLHHDFLSFLPVCPWLYLIHIFLICYFVCIYISCFKYFENNIKTKQRSRHFVKSDVRRHILSS